VRKENTNPNISIRSVYKIKTGITNKAEACKERQYVSLFVCTKQQDKVKINFKK